MASASRRSIPRRPRLPGDRTRRLGGEPYLSAVLVADRVEDVERLDRFVAGHDGMDDAAGDAEDVAGLEPFRLAADGEVHLAFEHEAHLLVGVRVLADD